MPNLAEQAILKALTSAVRIVSEGQVAEIAKCSVKRSVRRMLRKLEAAGQIECVGGMMLPATFNRAPLFRWQASSKRSQPNFDRLAYELKRRRFTERKQSRLFRATRQGFKAVNKEGQGLRPARRSDFEHDAGLTASWLSLRDEIEISGGRWVLEDDFGLLATDKFCKPDAIIQWPSGSLEFIEYGGSYSANTLRLKFESWWEVDWQLF